MARDAGGRPGNRPRTGGSARPGGAASAGAGPAAKKAQPGRPSQPGAGTQSGPAAQTRPGGQAAATAQLRAEIHDRLAPALADAGFDLEELSLSRAGSRSVLRVAVDRDGGIDLDAVADASRLISELLDQVGDEAGLTGAYVLEVTSPGVDRPLTEPRHWRRARGRLVEARCADGTVVLGRVLGTDDDGADLAVAAGPPRRGRPVKTRIERLRFTEVLQAVVQIEFGPAGASGGPDLAAATDAACDGGDADLTGAAGPAGPEFADEPDDEWADDGWVDGLDENDADPDQGGDQRGDQPGDDDVAGARRVRAGGGREDVGGSPGEETDR